MSRIVRSGLLALTVAFGVASMGIGINALVKYVPLYPLRRLALMCIQVQPAEGIH